MISHMLAAASDADWAIITDLGVILVSAAVVTVVVQPLRLATIPAYLIAGALIGPNALSLVPAPESLGAISHLAIMLLLFGIGLELHLSVFKHRLLRLLTAGFGSCVMSVLLGWPVATWFGLDAPAALAVSMAMSLSSTAVVLRIIAARRELRRLHGQLALSILVTQDMIVLAILAALPILAEWAGNTPDSVSNGHSMPDAQFGWLRFTFNAMGRVGVVATLITIGRLVLPRILSASLKGRSLEVMTIVSVAAALLAAVVTQAVGFSPEMGAFLAGFVLAGTPFRHQLSGQIGPLRDVFIAVFFTTLGMKLDPGVVAQWWWIIFLGVAVVTTLKAIVISATSWAVGTSAGVAILVGFSLAQAGEFSLIVLDGANGLGIIDSATAAAAIAVVVISLLLTPGLIELGGRLSRAAAMLGTAPWVRSASLRESAIVASGESARIHVIIAGYGPVGHLIAERLERAGISFTVVELNPATVQAQSRQGRTVIFGDVGNLEVLESAGIDNAAALVLTIPDEEAAQRTCAVVRRRVPGIFIAARTRVVSKRNGLAEAGADSITVDESSAGEEMARAVMAWFAKDRTSSPSPAHPIQNGGSVAHPDVG